MRRSLLPFVLSAFLAAEALAIPPQPVRQCAEFEPVEGVLIRYPLGIPGALVAEMSEETFDRVVAVNFKSVFLCCQAALPRLPDGCICRRRTARSSVLPAGRAQPRLSMMPTSRVGRCVVSAWAPIGVATR